jgi:hypothetical protein
MVADFARLTSVVLALAAPNILADQEPARSLLDRLDPERRAKLLMALLGVILAGVALVVLVILWARHARRIAGKPLQATQRHEDDWYRKPLVPRDGTSPQAREPD